jgi:hypothetical protein
MILVPLRHPEHLCHSERREESVLSPAFSPHP